jgi:hypothetical protein
MARQSALGLGEEELLYIHDGILYTPLLMDSTITDKAVKKAGKGPDRKPVIITKDDRRYIRAVNLMDLVSNYESINPAGYRAIIDELVRKYSIDLLEQETPYDNSLLETIIFGVMPHFVSINKNLLDRTEPRRADILEFIIKKEKIPLDKYRKKVRQETDYASLERAITYLRSLEKTTRLPQNGPIQSSALDSWLSSAVENSIVTKEAQLKGRILSMKQVLKKKEVDQRAVMLYLTKKGKLEIGGFGFMEGEDSEYLVYAHTGEYALESRKGKIFHFRDCKVAVPVDSDYIDSPLVIDNYKHPFLQNCEPMQDICIVDGGNGGQPTAKNIIKNIEEGINTLFYGYTLNGHFGGYQPLNGDFESDEDDYDISFRSYRIKKDDRRLKSGKLEIKNQSINRIVRRE